MGTDRYVTAWNFRSIPSLKDSDGDRLTDDNDPNPVKFDLYISGVYGNVLEFNTGNNYVVFGQDIHEFYQQYYTRKISTSRELLESMKRQLDMNRQVSYTVGELALLCNIDLNGVKDRLANSSTSIKQLVYQGYTGHTCTPQEAEEFFSVPAQKEVLEEYLAEFVDKYWKGKYEEKENLLASYTSLSTAFLGLDTAQDLRDLTYDVSHWENSWEHVGETVLDGMVLLPVVGIVGKLDEVAVLIKHNDKVFELRKLAKLDNVLRTIGESKYVVKTQKLAGTAMEKLQSMNPSVYRRLLNYCDNAPGYRAAYATAGSYNNPVIDTLSRHTDELDDLSKVSSSLTREVVEEVTKAGSRSADNLDDIAKEALDNARKRADEIVGGGSTLNDWINKIPELSQQAPIEIPSSATVKVQTKNGYDQISFKWTENGQNDEVRWHTKTPGAPEGQGNTWVVSRVTPGTPTGQVRTEHIFVGDTWVPRYQWQDAINAYRNGTATQEQLQLLMDGHWKAP